MKKLSKKYDLTVSDLQRRGRDLLVYIAPILLIILTDIENGNIDRSDSGKYFATLATSALCDIIRRFLQDYGQTLQGDDKK